MIPVFVDAHPAWEIAGPGLATPLEADPAPSAGRPG